MDAASSGLRLPHAGLIYAASRTFPDRRAARQRIVAQCVQPLVKLERTASNISMRGARHFQLPLRIEDGGALRSTRKNLCF